MPEDLCGCVKFSDGNYDLSSLLADSGLFAESIDGFLSMFDREVFDKIICCGGTSNVVSGALAYKLRKGVLSADAITTENLPAGTRVIVVADVLTSGERARSFVQSLMDRSVNVVRLGFIAEISEFGARKNKVLRKYPFEALVVL